MHGHKSGGKVLVGESDRPATDETPVRDKTVRNFLPQRRYGDAKLLRCLGIGVSAIRHACLLHADRVFANAMAQHACV